MSKAQNSCIPGGLYPLLVLVTAAARASEMIDDKRASNRIQIGPRCVSVMALGMGMRKALTCWEVHRFISSADSIQ